MMSSYEATSFEDLLREDIDIKSENADMVTMKIRSKEENDAIHSAYLSFIENLRELSNHGTSISIDESLSNFSDLEDVFDGFELKELNMAALCRAMEANRLEEYYKSKNRSRYPGRLTAKKHRSKKWRNGKKK